MWFEFSKFAIANRYRALDPEKISHSIQLSQPLIKSYSELAKRIDRKEDIQTIIQEAKILTGQIKKFFKTDPYISQAIYENAQIPYADWDENYGGS